MRGFIETRVLITPVLLNSTEDLSVLDRHLSNMFITVISYCETWLQIKNEYVHSQFGADDRDGHGRRTFFLQR